MINLEIELKSSGAKNDVYELRNYLQQQVEGLEIHIKEQPAQEGQMSGSVAETIIVGLVHLAVTIPLEQLYHRLLQPKIKEWLAAKHINNDEQLGVVISARDEKSTIVAEENSNGKSHFYKNLRYNINIEKTRALLIGNSEFGSSFSSIPPVTGNIQDFSELLTDKLHIGIPRENITIALNKSSTEIEELLLKSSKVADTETLIIYYTGHGYRSDVNKLYLIACNTVKIDDDIVGGVDLDFIRNRILKTSPARQKILILDACHSGIATQGDEVPVIPMDVEGTYILASSPGDDVSYFDKTRTNTYFTGALIDVLKNGINNFSEMLSLNDLYEYSKDFFIQKNSPQKPAYKSHLNIAPYNFFIARNPAFSTDKWIGKINQLYNAGKLKEALQEARQMLRRFPENSEVQKLQQQCSEELEFMEHVREGDEFFYQVKNYSAAKRSYEDAYELRKDMSVLGKIRKCENLLTGTNETMAAVAEVKEFKISGDYQKYHDLINKEGQYTALQLLLQLRDSYSRDTFLAGEISKLEKDLKNWSNSVNDPRLHQYHKLFTAGKYKEALTEIEKQEANDPLYPGYKSLHKQVEEKIKSQSRSVSPPTPVNWNTVKFIIGIAVFIAIAWFAVHKLKEESFSYSQVNAMLKTEPDKALAILKEKAEKEDSANFYLGNYYRQKEDYFTARDYYQKGSKLASSLSSIGEMLYNENLPDSPFHKLAIKYFTDANAIATDTTACYYLGSIAKSSYESPSSFFITDDKTALKKAEEWFKLGAKKESSGCIIGLAKLLYNYEKDYFTAFFWMKKAANLGDAECQNFFGYMYCHAQGTGKNVDEGIRWYRVAAGNGNPVAVSNLSWRYINGDGLPKDCSKGFDEVKATAWNDTTLALPCGNMAYIYETGCANNYSQIDSAYIYYKRGDRLGDDYCKQACNRLKIAGK